MTFLQIDQHGFWQDGPTEASTKTMRHEDTQGSLCTTRQNLVFLARSYLDVDVRKGDREMRGDGGDN
jgi:hypothetical protein